jgi:hypothetical protein
MTTQQKRTSRSGGAFADAGRKLDEAARRVEQETERLIAYLNDEVVPSAREHSTRGLRKAAQELSKFADYLESTRKR